MCNSLATFQSMMDATFRDLIDAGIVIIYMDDIFLFAKDPNLLEENTKLVLQQLLKNDLYLKLKKCKFAKTKIESLGTIIEKDEFPWMQENKREYEIGRLQLL